jgi:hypothetical protein
MLIDCPSCRAKVNADELKTANASSDAGEWQYTFLQCPVCSLPILAEQEGFPVGDHMDWEPPRRVWPETPTFSHEIPKDIRSSLAEAARCCDCGTFTASVAMAGRALEGLVRHFTNPQMYLGPGITELHNQGVIDNRLFDWAKALHLDRNVAAHSSGQNFSAEDAEDLLAFATAICEYVFVIAYRFDEFQKRRARAVKKGTP